MRYAFLGLLYDQNCEKQLLKMNQYSLQPQINQYEWGFISGMNEALHIKMAVFGSIPFGSFPRHSNVGIVAKDLIKSDYGVDYTGFINFYVIREKIRQVVFFRKLQTYVDSSDEPVTLFVYSLYHPFVKCIDKLKNKYAKKVRIVLIVPDLVGKYAIQYKNPFKKLFYGFHADEQLRLAERADAFVFLTEAMKNVINIQDKPYTIIEGFLPSLPYIENQNKSDKKIVMYAGSLNPAFGISALLKEFSLLKNPDYRLWICGPEGDASEVKKYSTIDNRIRYLGFLPKDQVAAYQRQATVLINPRTPDDEYTKYSFPSKTMEYMLSGTPVLMYRLEGIPHEYHQHVYLFDEKSKHPLKEKIMEICEKPASERLSFGQAAREFIMTEKTSLAQAQKVVRDIGIQRDHESIFRTEMTI